jgi:hypothetical protein
MASLRADAPAFVPSFSTHECVQNVRNVTPGRGEEIKGKKSPHFRHQRQQTLETAKTARRRRNKDKGRRKNGKESKSVGANIFNENDKGHGSQREKKKDRIRPRGRQNHHHRRHDRNDSKIPDAQEALESRYPPLSADNGGDYQHYAVAQGSTEWARVAKSAHLQIDLEAQEKKCETQFVHDSSSGVILTALVRGRNAGMSSQATDESPSPAPAPVHASVSDPEMSNTKLDTKLRSFFFYPRH